MSVENMYVFDTVHRLRALELEDTLIKIDVDLVAAKHGDGRGFVKAEDLRVVLDAASSTATGSVRYDVRIEVPKYDNVWVYYGENEQETYKLYGTIE